MRRRSRRCAYLRCSAHGDRQGIAGGGGRAIPVSGAGAWSVHLGDKGFLLNNQPPPPNSAHHDNPSVRAYPAGRARLWFCFRLLRPSEGSRGGVDDGPFGAAGSENAHEKRGGGEGSASQSEHARSGAAVWGAVMQGVLYVRRPGRGPGLYTISPVHGWVWLGWAWVGGRRKGRGGSRERERDERGETDRGGASWRTGAPRRGAPMRAGGPRPDAHALSANRPQQQQQRRRHPSSGSTAAAAAAQPKEPSPGGGGRGRVRPPLREWFGRLAAVPFRWQENVDQGPGLRL